MADRVIGDLIVLARGCRRGIQCPSGFSQSEAMRSRGDSPVNVTQHPAIDNFPAWTPDGKLAFVSNRADGFDIYVVPSL